MCVIGILITRSRFDARNRNFDCVIAFWHTRDRDFERQSHLRSCDCDFERAIAIWCIRLRFCAHNCDVYRAIAIWHLQSRFDADHGWDPEHIWGSRTRMGSRSHLGSRSRLGWSIVQIVLQIMMQTNKCCAFEGNTTKTHLSRGSIN